MGVASPLTAVARSGDRADVLEDQRDLFARIAVGAPLAEILDALVRQLERRLSPGSMASVLLLDEERGRLRHGAAPSLPEHYTAAIDGIFVGPAVGSCGTAAFRRAPVVVTDIATDPLWTDFRDLALPCGLAACWSVPIVGLAGETLGTFAVYTPAPGEPPPDDLATLHAFTHAASVAIGRDRDIARLVREKRRAEALLAVGKAINQRVELAEIAQIVTDAATELTGAALGAFLYNDADEEAGDPFSRYAVSGVPRDTFRAYPLPRETAIFGPTLTGRGILRLEDVTADARYGRNYPYDGMPPGHPAVRSYLGVPVVTPDAEVAGALFFGHPEPGVFDRDAEETAVGIASQAAIAIENARLYASARREIEARERAFRDRDRVATVLQQSLLPPRLPAIPGIASAAVYHASSQDLGGDFYDMFALDARRWVVVIGDVCGKGAEAAALTSLARHTVRAAVTIDPTPSEVLGVLNQVLADAEHDGRFCTAIVGLVELREDGATLTVAGAGHPPPLVLTPGGVTPLGCAGPVLGVLDEVVCADATVRLRRGESVLFHTDGLTEVRTAAGGILGDDWLRAELVACPAEDPDALLAAITERALAHQRPGAPRDDIAAVALRLV